MGAFIYANGAPDEISIGYIGFGMIRCQLASSFSEELGQIYEKPYKDLFFKGFSDLDKYPMKWPDNWRTDWLEKYERIKELIRWCAKARHTLYIR